MRIETEVNEIVDILITTETELTIDNIAYLFNFMVMYNAEINAFIKRKGHSIICLKDDTKDEMWRQFTHELGHFFLHYTDQQMSHNLFNHKQEAEADKFSILFRMPQKIIEDNALFTSSQIVQYFGVTEDEAICRLDMLMNYYKSLKVGVY